nr:ribonuclease H-like domain-containing protein [Tanacetum cinerariifolium]
ETVHEERGDRVERAATTASSLEAEQDNVVTDDFSRFTLTFFLKSKDETSGIIKKFISKIENLKDLRVKIIRCDNGREFQNKEINDFCSQKGIKREFSNARTPQQNGVAEKRNRTLIEAARTMLADAKLPVTFWAEAVNTACYVQNRVLVTKSHNKTPYELFNGRTPAIGFLKPFRCHVMILNTLDNFEKFEAKGDEGYFIGYSMSSKAFKVFNKRTKRVKENLHIEFLENKAIEKGAGLNWLFDIDSLTKSMNYVPVVDAGVRPIGTKWVLKNKKHDRGIVIKNKARLVDQGHTQEEGIDYDEVFVPVARIEAIRLFLAYASFMGFTVYQMDVKSAFLYGTTDEEVYVMQPPKFQDPEYPARVYKVEKAMYGLHQAPRAWYGTLSKYLLTNGFQRAMQRIEALMYEKFQMSAIDLQILTWTRRILEERTFWSTARIETTYEGTKILAIVDGILRTVTESSIRRNLKLNDEGGLSSLPDTELYENLTLMGYNISPNQKFTFQKGFNEFINNIATALVCLATNRTYNFSKMIFDGLVKNVNNKVSKFLMYPRARIAQSSALPPIVDEPASPMRDVSQGEACPIDFGFIADQDRENIAKTSTLPHESTSRVTSLAVDEGSLQLYFQELTDFCTSLQRQQQGEGINLSGDDAPIKERRLDEGEVAIERVSSDTKEIRRDEGEVASERVSDDIVEMATVLITMDAASVLLSGGVQVVPTAEAVAPTNVSISTSSGVVPTASTTISTATPIFATATTVTPYTRRKGKEKMVETHTPKKKKRLQEQTDIQFTRELEEELEREAQRMNAQIARDEEIAKIHAKEELQQMIKGLDRSNETIAKHLEEYEQAASELTIRERIELISELKRDFYMAVIRNNLGWKVKDFKGMSFEEVEAKFKTVWEQIEGGVFKISKGEAAWLKRKGIRSEQESAKKQKTSEEVLEEVKSSDEVFEEKIKALI